MYIPTWIISLALLGALCACSDPSTLSEGEHKRLRKVIQRGLAHSDVFVQSEAIRAIQLARPASLNDLRKARLDSSNTMLRAGSAVSIAPFEPGEARGALVSLISMGDPKKRIFLLRDALDALPAGEDRNQLITTALRSEDREFRITALLHGVGRDISNPKAQLKPFLKGVVGHKDTVVAGKALAILHARGQSEDLIADLIRDTKQGSDVAKTRALRVLAEAGIAEVNAKLPPLRPPEPEPPQPPPTDEDNPTEDPPPPPKPKPISPDVLIAHTATGQCEDLDILRKLLGQANFAQTGRIVRALRGCDSKEAYGLVRTHREDKNPELRLWAYRTMASHKHVQGKDFKRGLRDSDDHVTSAALQGLLQSAPRLFGGILDSALQESNNAARLLTLIAATRRRLEQEGDVSAAKTFDEEIVQVEKTLKAFLKDDDRNARAASAEVLFLLPNRDAIFKELQPPSLEVRYAWLDSHARNPDRQNPLQHLETFVALSKDTHLPTALIASSAIWNAFSQASQGASPKKPSEASKSAEPASP